MARDRERSPEWLAIHERVRRAFKAHREARGWSQRDMADFLQISKKSYQSYEGRPERGIPTDVIARFCKYTDADANYLLYGVPTGPGRPGVLNV